MNSDELQKRIIAKLDKLDERLDKVDCTLTEQHVTLKEHMRRTELLEQIVAPIRHKVAMAEGAIKLVTLFSVIMAIAVAIAKLKA